MSTESMPHHVLSLLQSAKTDWGKIVETVQALQEITQWIGNHLPEAIKPHCQVGHYQKGILTLVASSPAWGTQLRFHSCELLQKLRRDPKWANIRSIQVKVEKLKVMQVGDDSEEFEGPGLEISHTAAEQLVSLANCLDESLPGNIDLKAALTRLAKHAK